MRYSKITQETGKAYISQLELPLEKILVIRPIAKDVPTDGIEPGRTIAAGAILVNLMVYLAKQYEQQYDILPSIDVSFPEQDFTCNLGIFPRRKIDWLNDLIRVEPPISAFEIVIPTETPYSLADAIRQHYFPHGVKLAWVISPTHQSIWLLYPNQPTQIFTNESSITDPVMGIELPVSEVFA